jgi:hypothetical protein
MSEMIDWIREHRCTYDIQPVMEIDEGERVHLGFELNLHAELPIGERITKELAKDVDEIRDRLGEILESLIPKDVKARVERVPFRRGVRFPKGEGKNPMVTRSVRVFHPDYSSVAEGDRQKLRPTEERLAQMGIVRA